MWCGREQRVETHFKLDDVCGKRVLGSLNDTQSILLTLSRSSPRLGSRSSLLARSLVLSRQGVGHVLQTVSGVSDPGASVGYGGPALPPGVRHRQLRRGVVQRGASGDAKVEWGVAPKLEVNPWATVHDHCQAHLTHDHPKSMVSGVYYVKTPQGSGPITLYDARMMFNEPIVIHPRPGELILFPSWLSHQVMPTAVEGDQRMSIAFNAPGYWPATMDVGASYGLSTNAGSDQEGGGAADVVYP